MVLKRSLECGFVGYDALSVPRARRSARKRSLHKKTLDEGQLCAFELLAAVAGKLLQETESSSASSNGHISKEFIKQEPEYHVNEVAKTEHDGPGISEESVVSSALCLQTNIPKDPHKEAVNASTDAILKQIPSVATSACSAKVGSDAKPFIQRDKEEFKADDKFSRKDKVESCVKSSPPICLGEKANLVPCRVSIPDASHVKNRNCVKVDGKDDDEILSQCSDPKVQVKAYRSPTHIKNGRIRKLLTSNYWKSAPKLKEYRPINSGSKRSNAYNGDGSSCDNERYQQNTPFKKRKLVGQSSVVTQDRGLSGESASNTSEKAVHNRIDSPPKPREGNGFSSSTIDCQRSSISKNSHVKFSIKSFKVPELLIEVPESTTVGSLKNTVMDAVTAVLGGGLHVGVLLRGKKIRDDNRTLLQNGLSEDDNHNDLAFILEPSSPTQPSPNSPPETLPTQLTPHPPKDYSNRSLNPKEELPLLDTPRKTSSTRVCHDLVPFTAPELENKPVSESRALVPAPENVEAMVVVPLSARPRRSEMGQRRTRRPFSVSEVEALVQAVEKLGTGRWRDVKLCAFENAKHRTYVDLKDKWKTLVHTAKIAPQQRRGEPVPQELLDRVLAAHSRWSYHQARLQPAGSSQALRLTDSLADKVSA